MGKLMTFTSPVGLTRMFLGATSRWTMPAFCASSRAWPIWATTALAWPRPMVLFRNSRSSDSPSNSSIATYSRSSGVLPQSMMVAMRALCTRISCFSSRSARASTAGFGSTSELTILYATWAPVWLSVAR